MTITRTKAQKLLSVSEYRLYESSRRGVVDDHGATRLKKLVDNTRKHVDKYRGRAVSQARAGRSSRSGPAAAENTALKVEIFEDILARFEAALVRAESRKDPSKGRARPKAKKAEKKAKEATKKAPAKKAAKKATKKAPAKKATKKASARKASAKKATPTKKASTRAATKKSEVRATAASKRAPIAEKRARKNVAAAKTTQLAHGAARGRRNQAKRDKR